MQAGIFEDFYALQCLQQLIMIILSCFSLFYRNISAKNDDYFILSSCFKSLFILLNTKEDILMNVDFYMMDKNNMEVNGDLELFAYNILCSIQFIPYIVFSRSLKSIFRKTCSYSCVHTAVITC